MWTETLFGVRKPIIALLHLRALPGDPLFQAGATIQTVLAEARRELHDLQEGGVDGILIANEFSLPYEKRVSAVTVAAMGYIIGALREEIRVPFGVNIVSNPMASVDLAAATGADFIRSAFTGAYVGEGGIIDTDIAAVMRRKKALGLGHVKLLFKVNPESDVYLAERSIERITKSIIFHCFPDGLCVSGDSAGTEADSALIQRVRAAAEGIPVLCNTGCCVENIREKLEYCDSACVGTAFKKDGEFHNCVDAKRVAAFMERVREFREGL